MVFQHLLADPEVFSGQMMLIIPPGGFLCEGVAKLLQVASSGPQTQSMVETEAPTEKLHCTSTANPPLASVSMHQSICLLPFHHTTAQAKDANTVSHSLFHLGAMAVVKGNGENLRIANLRFTPTCIWFLV